MECGEDGTDCKIRIKVLLAPILHSDVNWHFLFQGNRLHKGLLTHWQKFTFNPR